MKMNGMLDVMWIIDQKEDISLIKVMKEVCN